MKGTGTGIVVSLAHDIIAYTMLISDVSFIAIMGCKNKAVICDTNLIAAECNEAFQDHSNIYELAA